MRELLEELEAIAELIAKADFDELLRKYGTDGVKVITRAIRDNLDK